MRVMVRPRALASVLMSIAALTLTAAPGGTPPSIDDLTWSPMLGSTGSALANGAVWAVAVDGKDVYVGGAFTDFAGIPNADRIARWNGATNAWEALAPTGASDGPLNAGTVYSISVAAGVVYAGGSFTVETDDGDCDRLASYTLATSTWSGFGTCPGSQLISNGAIYAVKVVPSGRLYVGGSFTDADGDANDDYGIYGTYAAGLWTWSGLGDDGAGGPALSAFVSNFAPHPDGGVIVVGDFGTAGGVAGANSVARFDDSLSPAWIAQDPDAVTYYGALKSGSDLFVSGWEHAYIRTSGNSWRRLCTVALVGGGSLTWGSMAVTSNDLLLVGGSGGLYACDTTDGGTATLVPDSGFVRALASYRGATIVGSSSTIDGGSDYIAILGELLPDTSRDGGAPTTTQFALALLAALTALAGTRLLRRA
jgi:hypothetical protein